MWYCTNCQAAVGDGIDVCGSCGGGRAGGEALSLTQSAEEGGVATEAAPAVVAMAPAPEAIAAPAVETVPPPSAEPTAWEILRALESELSALMDARATADWKVNPAFHADVNAFIQKHSNNGGFVQKARGLQQNRAKFYAKMRELESAAPKPLAEAPPMATEIVPGEMASAETVPAETPPAPTSTPVVAPAPGGSRLVRRLVRITLLMLVGLVGLVLVAAVGYRQYGKKQLEDAISETNRLSPGWQWKTLQVNRAEVPDDQNAALVVLEAVKIAGWHYPREAGRFHVKPAMNWAKDRAKYLPAVKMARRLEKLSRGRYPDGEPDYEYQLKDVCRWLLDSEALFLAREDQPDEALAVWRCLFNASRSMGDEPGAGQDLRLSLVTDACQSLHRILAMTPSPNLESLTKTQALLASEIDQPVLAMMLRGYRARSFEILSPPNGHENLLIRSFPWFEKVPASCKPALGFLLAGEALRQRAQELRWTNLMVQLADLQPHEMASRADPLPEVLAYHELDSLPAISDYLKYQVELRCAMAALAAERYRLAHQDWPTELNQLVPEFLDKVPLDPYDAKPLRLKRGEGELVIYSVGSDQQDQEGQEDDIGCRLVDVLARRPSADK